MDLKKISQCGVIRELVESNFPKSTGNSQVDNHTNGDHIFWPNYDNSVTLRSCEEEVIEPLQGEVKGTVPKWLKGTLFRNGPGSLKVGPYEFKHWFDGSALLHRFEISDGKITYQNRFVQTEVYKKNHTAGRIVVDEFATEKIPDPCESIFHRLTSFFDPIDKSDNTVVSIHPLGDEFYTFTDFPFIHRIDPKTLETLGRVNLSEHINNIVNHTSHPHSTKNGQIYNLGLRVTSNGLMYSVVRFTPVKVDDDDSENCSGTSMFDKAEIVASIPPRRKWGPSYMHSFGMTENYFIIIEQPVCLQLSKLATSYIKRGTPVTSTMQWLEKENTYIHVVSRQTGTLVKTFISEPFFYFHMINQFETLDDKYIVLDICVYKDSKALDGFSLDIIKNVHKNPDYPSLLRVKPLRFVMPMTNFDENVPTEENLIPGDFHKQLFDKILGGEQYEENVEEIFAKKAAAYKLSSGDIFVTPELLCDLGCELPRYDYVEYSKKEYRYFYGLSSDADLGNSAMLIKVDTITKTKKTWRETNAYPSEPIFVPSPDRKTEDDGIIIASVIWGNDQQNNVSILILDAKSFTEIARADFETQGPVPRCIHGWFDQDNILKT